MKTVKLSCLGVMTTGNSLFMLSADVIFFPKYFDSHLIGFVHMNAVSTEAKEAVIAF